MHQGAADVGASGLLDVQENDQVMALDVEFYLEQEVTIVEIVPGHEAGRALIL